MTMFGSLKMKPEYTHDDVETTKPTAEFNVIFGLQKAKALLAAGHYEAAIIAFSVPELVDSLDAAFYSQYATFLFANQKEQMSVHLFHFIIPFFLQIILKGIPEGKFAEYNKVLIAVLAEGERQGYLSPLDQIEVIDEKKIIVANLTGLISGMFVYGGDLEQRIKKTTILYKHLKYLHEQEETKQEAEKQ